MTKLQLSVESLSYEELIKGIPLIDHVVHSETLFEDSKALLLKVFPEWASDGFTLKQCKDGITNKRNVVIQCTNKKTKTTVLIRAYGRNTDTIIDRNQELINMAGLMHVGMCPPLYSRFTNGLVYGFVPGNVVKPEEMGKAPLALLIAKKLSEWHQVLLPGDHSPKLFKIIREWINIVPKQYQSSVNNEKFYKNFNIEDIHEEINMLENVLLKHNSPVVFSHNDLLSGNVILSESKDAVSFIDYEYATYSFRGFDIANHFCEYAGFECDYTRYPSKEEQLLWFKIYLDNIGMDSSSETLEKMYVEVCQFSLASHFYWGVWALVQASISDLDFDYMEYAIMRFAQYYKTKSIYL